MHQRDHLAHTNDRQLNIADTAHTQLVVAAEWNSVHAVRVCPVHRPSGRVRPVIPLDCEACFFNGSQHNYSRTTQKAFLELRPRLSVATAQVLAYNQLLFPRVPGLPDYCFVQAKPVRRLEDLPTVSGLIFATAPFYLPSIVRSQILLARDELDGWPDLRLENRPASSSPRSLATEPQPSGTAPQSAAYRMRSKPVLCSVHHSA